MDGSTIILICVAGLVSLAIYLIYRLDRHRKKTQPVKDLSSNIGEMDRKQRNDPDVKKQQIHIPVIPEKQLIVILNRKTGQNWKKAVNGYLKQGRRCVIVSVTDPAKLRHRYRGDAGFIWLERSTAHDVNDDSVVVNPTNLSMILQEIDSMIDPGGLVVIASLEDMLDANDPPRVIRFLRMLDDSCSRKRFSAIAPASYRAIPQRVRVHLTESFDTLVI